MEGALITVAIVSVTVLAWWFLVLKPRMKKYVAENTIYEPGASASIEIRHTEEPRLRPMRVLVVANLPVLKIGDSRMERITKRVGFEEIQDADYIIAIDINGDGTVVKDRDGFGEEGWEVHAFVHRVING